MCKHKFPQGNSYLNSNYQTKCKNAGAFLKKCLILKRIKHPYTPSKIN